MELFAPSFGLITWTIASALAILALVDMLLSRFGGRNEKLAWILVIVLIPVFGPVLYFGLGRKHRLKTKSN